MSRGINKGKIEPINKTWLSKSEAQTYLGCSGDFLESLRNKAEVSFSKYGQKIWYELRSLDRFLERNRVI